MKQRRVNRRCILTLAGLMSILVSQAQTADGNAGINQANTMVRSYFEASVNLMFAVGAIVGIIGAVHVHGLWVRGDHTTTRVATAWFGSCIFLVVVSTILRAFFGL